MRKERVALSLFSGAGGMDIGVRQAGFTVLAEVESDPHACSTLRAAAEREQRVTRVIESDIRKIDPQALMNELGLKAGELDLLFGGPPCQSFSLAGKQLGLNDARGLLLFEMARFAAVFQPKAMLIEQVKGLLSAKGEQNRKGEVFEHFLQDLESIHYCPKWRVLVAADFGVPQLRERLFVVATRDRNGFMFPERTHAPKDECNGLFPLEPYNTVGAVLGGLGKPAPKTPGKPYYESGDSHVDVTPERDRERIHLVPEGSYLAAQTHLSLSLRRNLTAKDTTKYLRIHRQRPANTLRCGEIFYHPTEDRYLTPREYMRIHGYPDDYYLIGPIRSRSGTVRNLDQHRQVANSVPPPVARALSAHILSYLHEQNL
ncbi:MAG: DNA cytosine methyltransferase [Chlorobi bacterium]|nr:DNA cytosine methyltransferase [Chlorobiota bacterium]MBX7216058.1 DNA cytosine methyltransferase [Candidatus Kapabacteria bacterium]